MKTEKKKHVVIDDFGFYAILTDPLRGYEYCTEILVEQQIRFIQLRIKNSSPFKVLKIAEKMRTIIDGSESLFIINDFIEVAKDCDADGVHIGQDDMRIEDVRSIFGDKKIIGISTHNPNQTKDACAKAPDYIGVGPVYATKTKEIPDQVLGLTTMAVMVEDATVPTVCIGGISLKRLPDVLAAGAKNFSMVSPVCTAKNPRKIIQEIKQLISLNSHR